MYNLWFIATKIVFLSTVSKVLRQRDKYLFPEDRSLSPVKHAKGKLRRQSVSAASDTVAESQSESIAALVSLTEKSKDSLSSIYTESSTRILSKVQPESFQSKRPEESAILSQPNSLTDSTCSEDETDWEVGSDDDMTNMHTSINSQGIDFEESLIQTRLTPAKAQLVNRLMEEFWEIFNQDWKANIQHRGSESAYTSGSTSNENYSSSPNMPSDPKGTKRSRRNADDGSDGNNGRRSKRGGSVSEPSNIMGNYARFACPYRKNNPRKYCVQRYKHCAPSSHATVARVKAHLYTYHSINQCERCKDLFGTVKELEAHTIAEPGCPSRTAYPVDGITRKIKEQLQCRKKAYPGQTESERWVRIYEILFNPMSNEVIPSPYFEQIQDLQENTAKSPDSRGLANYEDYLRRELPRFFNTVLQNAVSREVQPIEEKLLGQMMNFLEEAQNRAFSSYRATLSPTLDPELASPEQDIRASDATIDGMPTAILERFYQSLAPQMNSASLLDMSGLGTLDPRDFLLITYCQDWHQTWTRHS
ncbi:hypothetical protein L207DRAFT_526205 [Hyaloscypha variabilis F]|uniref:C2H2-type domain-containing protein n=1 Tax=Hyaloscypha variabilis (strain UAMH 11265 / GT02V1 / F) TaxID=1149755 RepID=A0A2J6RWV9_HYAVF|nr:hypothetical protein L207DRAFT_526205 [Hyaloscypha variabilis F]